MLNKIDGSLGSMLLDFMQLVLKWNQKINLTADDNPTVFYRRHILDSLSILPYLHGTRILDVGTGAGLPGIPLSIFCPEKSFYLLDSNLKKQVFVSQAVKSLSLRNVQCVHSLVQTYQPAEKFSTIVTRAFAPLEKILPLTHHLLDVGGKILVMRGKMEEEHPPLPQGYNIQKLIKLDVPGESAQRHLAIIMKDENNDSNLSLR